MSNPVPFFDLGTLIRSHESEILTELSSVIDSGVYIGGQAVAQFENSFSRFLGSNHFLGVGNGLDALRLSLEVIGVGAGDEVIVPSFTYYATWLAVIQVGATPIFADVEASSANIDPSQLADLVTARTKAIIVVHLYGRPAKIKEISELAHNHGIDVIEDCAQSHGATLDNQKVGTFGTLGAFSFYPTKNLGALGDAGGIATDDDEFAELILSRRSYGRGKTKYDHIRTGWNSRLDPIQAKVLSVHLKKLDDWNTRRRFIAETYLKALEGVPESTLAPATSNESVWHHFVVQSAHREALIRELAARGVTTDIHYPYAASSLGPLSRYVLRQDKHQFQNAEKLASTVLSLPMGPWMNEAQIYQVAGSLADIATSKPELLGG